MVARCLHFFQDDQSASGTSPSTYNEWTTIFDHSRAKPTDFFLSWSPDANELSFLNCLSGANLPTLASHPVLKEASLCISSLTGLTSHVFSTHLFLTFDWFPPGKQLVQELDRLKVPDDLPLHLKRRPGSNGRAGRSESTHTTLSLAGSQ